MYRRTYAKKKHKYRCYIYVILSCTIILYTVVSFIRERYKTYDIPITYYRSRKLLQKVSDEYHDIDKEHFSNNDEKNPIKTTTILPTIFEPQLTLSPTLSTTTAITLEASHLNTSVTTYLSNNTIQYLNSSTKPKTNESSTLKEEPCELPAISEFPKDLFSHEQRRRGALLFHVLITVYMFLGLAIVCDYYFVSSLEVIVYKLHLQADVAGASLMAIGSSAPELFASIIGVFITKGDIGIGTILGSAVFNVLFVLGFSGILAKTELKLSWWPVTRDSLCYSFVLITLTVTIFDGTVTWKEAAFMLLLYVSYLVLMWYNERIEKWFYEYIDDKESYRSRFYAEIEEKERANAVIEEQSLSNDNIVELSTTTQYDDSNSTDSDAEAYPDEPPKKLFFIPETDLGKVGWLFALPANIIFYLTIPDIRRKSCRAYNTLTFIMSILWIGLLTYILVWMVTIIGFTFSIPDTVMGLTFIAFGSSVPDALSSILVARQGKGDMAVSQALGSNVFDILFGLGLPWLIKTLIFDLDSTIEVQSIGMLMSCFIIFFLMLGMLFSLYYRNFILSKKLGLVFLVAYVLFLIISITLEIFVWSAYELPPCHINA